MTDIQNPYEPPAWTDERETWWSRIRAFFRRPDVRSQGFANGDPIICEGIAFFITPEDPTTAYAGSPSTDISEQRMNLIVSEAIRTLPLFLAEHPDLHEYLRGRRLSVGILCNDYDKQPVFRHAKPLNWDILNALLSAAESDELDAR